MSTRLYVIPGSRLAKQHEALNDKLEAAIARVMQRAVFTPGGGVEAFESEFARYVGSRYAIGVASGGIALMLTLQAIGIEPGDEVISVPNVDISASAPVTHAGARLVWADIDPRTYNLDPEHLEKCITPRTRAIVVTHMYGNPADMDPVLEIARKYRLAVVEDAALAHGARYKGRRVGSLGDAGCFSFSPGKPLSAVGKAGIMTTDDPELAQRVRILSSYGFKMSSLAAIERGVPGAPFEYALEGYNARLDELQAAVLCVKLPHLDAWVERRQENAARYRQLLGDLEPDFVLLPHAASCAEPAWRFFVIRTPARDRLLRHLADAGIWAGVAYIPPLHVQPVYQYLGYGSGSFPCTERVANELLCLPTYPELSRQEVEQVATTVRQFFRSASSFSERE